MTALHEAATNALVHIDAQRLTSSTTSGWPVWADDAVCGGEPNAHFDAKDAARRLTVAQREGMDSLLRTAESRMTPPNDDARAHFAMVLVEIAARVQPGLGEEQTKGWANGIIFSFSQTPMDLVAKAIEAARFKQFQFVSEVGKFIEDEIAEPLRTRRAKISRLKEIQLAARALPAPGKPDYCPEDEASRIVAKMQAEIRAKRAERGDIPAATPAERAEIDWDAETMKRNADANFVRALHGLPTRTVDEYKRDQAESIRKLRGLPDDEGYDGLMGEA